MKKLFSILLILFIAAIAIPITLAESDLTESDPTEDWYQYNGYSSAHSFSTKFPQDWQAKTYGDDLQGFAPEGNHEDSLFLIQEFEGSTFDQAMQYYVNENVGLIEVSDFIFPGDHDFLAKEAIYINKSENKSYPVTFIKRGSLIVALSGKNLEEEEDFPVSETYREIIDNIYDSFNFTDEWYQYIDLEDSYTFIFPSALEIENLDSGVTITDPGHLDNIIFTVIKYESFALDDAPKEAEGYQEDLSETADIFFHGIQKAISATYYNTSDKKHFSRIFVENNDSTYSISDVNIDTNYPRMDYYNEYLVEMVESFEFFDIDQQIQTYKYFPDILGDHPNKQAINSLKEKGIIDGYPDGTFQPDAEINRAELTKLIVAAKVDEDIESYNNCFPDVKEEWFAPYICYAKEQNWVEGYPDKTFKPEKPINRAEALKIILEVIFEESIEESETLEDESVADIGIELWYGTYFIFADNRDLLDKQHITVVDDKYYYYPDENISRKEVAETIYRSLINLPLTFL
jgi:hypothetical protein